jgi:predicted metal-dependent phosphoesterase TrpH
MSGRNFYSYSDNTLKAPGAGVDFHMHTLASDGLWTTEKLIETAAEQGLRVLAVSDHDTIESVRPAQELGARKGIKVIPGVEITINWKNAMYHMLVFNFNPDDPALNALLADTDKQVTDKKTEMIEALKKKGYKLHKLDELKNAAGNYQAIEIARALYLGGEVPTFDQAMRLGWQVGMERICSQSADKAIAVSLAAGGIPIMAHPGREEHGFKVASLEVLREMVEFGLAGVEVYHYSHPPAEVERYRNFAKQNELIISAGSDSHNESRKPTPWDPELVRNMLERLNVTPPKAEPAWKQAKRAS